MPICTVARNRSGFWRSAASACALDRRSPSKACSLVWRTDTTAISAPARMPLAVISSMTIASSTSMCAIQILPAG